MEKGKEEGKKKEGKEKRQEKGEVKKREKEKEKEEKGKEGEQEKEEEKKTEMEKVKAAREESTKPKEEEKEKVTEEEKGKPKVEKGKGKEQMEHEKEKKRREEKEKGMKEKGKDQKEKRREEGTKEKEKEKEHGEDEEKAKGKKQKATGEERGKSTEKEKKEKTIEEKKEVKEKEKEKEKETETGIERGKDKEKGKRKVPETNIAQEYPKKERRMVEKETGEKAIFQVEGWEGVKLKDGEVVWMMVKNGRERGVAEGELVLAKKEDGGVAVWVRWQEREEGDGEDIWWEEMKDRDGQKANWRLRRKAGIEQPGVWGPTTFSPIGRRKEPPKFVKLAQERRGRVESGAAGGEGRRGEAPKLEVGQVGGAELEAGEQREGCIDGLTWEWVGTSRVFPVKKIPKSARLLWADVVARALTGVVKHADEPGRWLRLLALPKLCLRMPQGGKKKQRAFQSAPHLQRLLKMAADGRWQELLDEAKAAEGRKSGQGVSQDEARTREALRERVMGCVEAGQFSKAVKTLASEGMHELTEEVKRSLQSKHPQGPPLPPAEPTGHEAETPHFEVEEVLRRLRSFRRGTAPGASKWRVEHFLDALTIPAGDSDGRLSGALAQVVNILAAGKAPEEIGPWLGGAPVYPLKKKGGGVRPIAVGEVLRRLVSKCFCARVHARAQELFVGMGQVGVGVKGGVEAALLAVKKARRDDSKVVLKVDVENAFNSISRAAILEKVKQKFPELEGWYRFCYGKPAKLFCDGEVLPFGSAVGVQQGDPLGPFLFSLGISGCCSRLKSELGRETLSVWYLDDGTLVGKEEEVAKGWKVIQEEMGRVGLRVNVQKCEVWGLRERRGAGLEGIPRVDGEGIELLGGPLGDSLLLRQLRGETGAEDQTGA